MSGSVSSAPAAGGAGAAGDDDDAGSEAVGSAKPSSTVSGGLLAGCVALAVVLVAGAYVLHGRKTAAVLV